MTSNKVIKAVAKNSEFTQHQVETLLQTTEDVIKSLILDGENVKFCDLKLKLKKMAARKRFMVHTQTTEEVPESFKLECKPSDSFKELIDAK